MAGLHYVISGLHYVISGLDVLQYYPDIKEYIKNFDGDGGFTYTTNTDPHYNAEIEKQMLSILNSAGVHSGYSWGCMLRGIQAVLKGSLTRESIEEQIVEYEKNYNDFVRQEQLKNAKLKDEREEFRIERDDRYKHL